MDERPLIQKKICRLGAFAVGKTSLVARFVHSIFSDKYHTTVGVKIDKKPVALDEADVNLIVWDLYGEDDFQEVRMSYLRGAAGYLLVVDGTRASTLDTAVQLQKRAKETIGDVPFLVLLNKSDLTDAWTLPAEQTESVRGAGWTLLETSAKSGRGVDEAFIELARRMVADR